MYHESRSSTTPTAARVIELLESLSATDVTTHDGRLLAVSPPEPDALPRQVLSLLKVPLRAYGIAKRTPRDRETDAAIFALKNSPDLRNMGGCAGGA